MVCVESIRIRIGFRTVLFIQERFGFAMEGTVRAVDVADAILEQLLPGKKIGVEKFHSLLYICQGICLGVTGRVLFEEMVEAWRDGPVVPDVHYLHRGVDLLSYGSLPEGSRKELDSASLRIVDYVVANYGLERGDFLQRWVCGRDTPWDLAFSRGGCYSEIDVDMMQGWFARDFERVSCGGRFVDV